jgi:hypothetical protein
MRNVMSVACGVAVLVHAKHAYVGDVEFDPAIPIVVGVYLLVAGFTPLIRDWMSGRDAGHGYNQ